eukprot:CAMPEP_0118991288 /NCGR_PEP_ID=MMETSP1173-20130426/51376_1 /TAXON_ID=1034831 /ORGANISM="Rhizochromulina marina cf, Strain CCMP1243" /LENGTH=157 /DNA_ID=CAMNT_0006942403 /DNA_START=460 /DNA_END=934 /DNA_ORIENTATION=-
MRTSGEERLPPMSGAVTVSSVQASLGGHVEVVGAPAHRGMDAVWQPKVEHGHVQDQGQGPNNKLRRALPGGGLSDVELCQAGHHDEKYEHARVSRRPVKPVLANLAVGEPFIRARRTKELNREGNHIGVDLAEGNRVRAVNQSIHQLLRRVLQGFLV